MEMVTRLFPRPLSSATRVSGRRVKNLNSASVASHTSRPMAEKLFRDVLVREWKRANRFEQPLALVLVEGPTKGLIPWSSVLDVVSDQAHETDVLGWFTKGRALGLLRPRGDASSQSTVRDLKRQVRRQLSERLDPNVAALLSVAVHVSLMGSRSEASAADPMFVRLRDGRSQSRVRAAVKRGLDVIGSFALLVALSPLLALIAVLVKLTSAGPVFFSQVRVGASGKPFEMLKFRTMRVDCDHSLHQQYVTHFITAGDGAAPADESGLFKIVNDPRVTFVGRVLRKTSLDELPQLWNVLRGDMSLVGPRPPLAYEVEQYKRWHYRRVLEAKPGITGLWQVTGRSRTSFDDMVRLDLRYVQTQSAWTDIKILLATPRAVISGKGAC